MDDTDKIKLKMAAIWKARDNEVGAIKDRALLVWGFLMFCYGGYAYLAARIILNCGKQHLCDSHLGVINMALLFLALVAFRLSLNWVRMMKGAKAWAENYDYLAENFQHLLLPLCNVPRMCPCFSPKVLTAGEKAVFDKVKGDKNCAKCQGDPSYACIFSVTDPTSGYYTDIDENVLTTKGGAFSPAKVAISIARMSLIISFLLCVAHLVVAWRGIDSCRKIVVDKDWIKWFAVVAFFILAVLPLFPWLGRILAISWLRGVFLMDDTGSMGLSDSQKIRNVFCRK